MKCLETAPWLFASWSLPWMLLKMGMLAFRWDYIMPRANCASMQAVFPALFWTMVETSWISCDSVFSDNFLASCFLLMLRFLCTSCALEGTSRECNIAFLWVRGGYWRENSLLGGPPAGFFQIPQTSLKFKSSLVIGKFGNLIVETDSVSKRYMFHLSN